MGVINESDVKTIYLNKAVRNRILMFGVFILTLFNVSAYFILIAPQQQQTLSIVLRPCGNDTGGA